MRFSSASFSDLLWRLSFNPPSSKPLIPQLPKKLSICRRCRIVIIQHVTGVLCMHPIETPCRRKCSFRICNDFSIRPRKLVQVPGDDEHPAFKGGEFSHADVRRFAERGSAFCALVEGWERVVVVAAVANGTVCGVCGDGVALVKTLFGGSRNQIDVSSA